MAASKTIIWNGVSSSTVPGLVIGKVTRQLLGEFRGNLVSVPGKDGSWFFPEQRGARQITAECFIEASGFPTPRRNTLESLANWLDVPTKAALRLSDEPGIFYDAVLTTPPEPDEWREFSSFELTWAADPYSYATTVSTRNIAALSPIDHTWDPDVLMDVYPVITLKPTNGTLLGFVLEVNGKQMIWQGSRNSNQSLTINSISAVVVLGVNTDTNLTGAYPSGSLAMARMLGYFPVLRPGNNNIKFTRTSGSATDFVIDVVYRKKYRR